MKSFAGKVEDLDLTTLGGSKVDVLVSEWMGYALLFESMLPSVLYARDCFLRPGGAILPDRAAVYACACDDAAAGLAFWDSVHGFNFPDVKLDATAVWKGKAAVANVDPKCRISKPACVREFDFVSMTADDCSFQSVFELIGIERTVECHCVVLWFDVVFSSRFCAQTPVVLSTSVVQPPTHWGQSILLLKEPVSVSKGDILRCQMDWSKAVHRGLAISLEIQHCRPNGSVASQQTAVYDMLVGSSRQGSDH